MTQYVMRQGKKIAVVDVATGHPPKKSKRKQFEPEWIKVPIHWVKALRQSRSPKATALAHIILIEDFKNHRNGREIVLSTEVTGMPRNTKIKAMKELVRLGLIKIHSKGNQAIRVTPIIIRRKNNKK
jgi:hypothetical protein